MQQQWLSVWKTENESPSRADLHLATGLRATCSNKPFPQTSDHENWEQIILSEIWALSSAKTIKKWLDLISH